MDNEMLLVAAAGAAGVLAVILLFVAFRSMSARKEEDRVWMNLSSMDINLDEAVGLETKSHLLLAQLDQKTEVPDAVTVGGVAAAPTKVVDPFTFGSKEERRLAPRRRGAVIDIQVSDASGTVEPVRGRILDRSSTGLKIELDDEGDVAIGTVLSIRPANTPRPLPWTQVEVRNRKYARPTWRLGCKYVRTPAYDVLLHFG